MKYSISLHMKWFILRTKAKTHLRHERNSRKFILDSLTREQFAVFALVEDFSKKHPESILYDKITNETLIVRDHVLISICDNVINIDNTTGFPSKLFPKSAYLLLQNIVDKNAHRYRRGLKQAVHINRIKFLQTIANEN